ncbi:MAG: hypothetical protein ACLFQX_02940 [Candidatus Kapaibacterium sp.]
MFSPTGDRIAFSALDRHNHNKSHIYIKDDTNIDTEMIAESKGKSLYFVCPKWSTDGSGILFWGINYDENLDQQ